MWTEAVYSGAGGKWGFTFSFVNCGSADLKVTEIQVFTTYHDPAANTTTDPQVVQTLQPNLTVKATKSGGFQSGRTAFSPPPRDASATSMLPKYYNDYPTITDGTIACQHTAVTPSDPGYPDCAKRLAHDGCFVRITYTQGGVLQPLLTLTFDDTVACAVVAGCK